MKALSASKESLLRHPSDFDYNFYVDSLYKSDAIELSHFKCVAFLEGYHRYLIEANGKSRIKTQKEVYSDSIMNLLKRADVFQSDKFQDLLNRLEIKELNLPKGDLGVSQGTHFLECACYYIF